MIRWNGGLKATIGMMTLLVMFGVFIPAAAACLECAEARSLLQAGDCKEAVKVLKKAVKDAPENPELHALLAMCHVRLGKPKVVLESALNCLQAGPSIELVSEMTAEVTANPDRPKDDSIQFEAAEEVSAPILLIKPRPVYPEMASEMGIVADIRLEATVGPDGVAVDLAIIESDNSIANEEAGLHEAALNAVLGWRFLPGLAGAVPVAVKMTCTVRFNTGT